jgi:hypothetical protein
MLALTDSAPARLCIGATRVSRGQRKRWLLAVAGSTRRGLAPVGAPWLWTILSYQDRQPVHGYKVTCKAAMAAFAKNWRRE